MEISTLQIIAIFIFSCIAGMAACWMNFRPIGPYRCTVIGLILGDLKTGLCSAVRWS
ncbi:sorbose permease IIC component [Klebsiella aerogenes]|nr:sorbose permease IIC component [Klebsiella aerogenes]